MRKVLVAAFVFANTLLFPLKGQQSEFELQGVLTVDSLQTISIKLNFSIDEQGNIAGKSITDFDGDDRTVSNITGQFEPAKNAFSFKETENIATQSKAESSSFCFIEASGLKIQALGGQAAVKGNFNGFFPSGEKCATGKIMLVGNTLQIPAKDNPESNQAKEVKKPAPTPAAIDFIALGADEQAELTNGSTKHFKWKSDTVVLEVWDQFEEDNDRVNIYYNGELVHGSIEVKNRKKTFYFQAQSETSSLRIEAENEGERPPNTVKVRLIDGNKVQVYNSKLRKGEAVRLEIVKRQSATKE